VQQQVAALGRGGRIIGSSSKQRAASSSSSPIFAPLAWEWMTPTVAVRCQQRGSEAEVVEGGCGLLWTEGSCSSNSWRSSNTSSKKQAVWRSTLQKEGHEFM
jgi:hypothetical protein